MEKFTVQETKEVLELGFALVAAGKCAFEDGKVNLLDLGCVVPVFPKLGPGIENIATVPKELGDLSEAESDELLALVKSKLAAGVDDARARLIAEKVLVLGLAFAELYSAVRK